jgi:hypothetical protein
MIGRAVALAVLAGLVILAISHVLLAGVASGLMWGMRASAGTMDIDVKQLANQVRSDIDRHNKGNLAAHLGPVDGVTRFAESVDGDTRRSRFRFVAATQDIAAISSRLNLVPYPLRSRSDHGLKQSRNDPDWWRPDDELTCCTYYRGRDASGTGTLLLVYNSERQVAYAVFEPASLPDRTERRAEKRR